MHEANGGQRKEVLEPAKREKFIRDLKEISSLGESLLEMFDRLCGICGHCHDGWCVTAWFQRPKTKFRKVSPPKQISHSQ